MLLCISFNATGMNLLKRVLEDLYLAIHFLLIQVFHHLYAVILQTMVCINQNSWPLKQTNLKTQVGLEIVMAHRFLWSI